MLKSRKKAQVVDQYMEFTGSPKGKEYDLESLPQRYSYFLQPVEKKSGEFSAMFAM